MLEFTDDERMRGHQAAIEEANEHRAAAAEMTDPD
jgi:hypothetical protein